MSERKFALGLDYGTNSVRALIVDTSDGTEIAGFVFNYPSGRDGIIEDGKDPNVARQNPMDYLIGLEKSVKKAVEIARKNRNFSPDKIIGIGIDTTGSTPIPVDEQGTPLCFHSEFKNNPNAMAWLWKDHTGFAEAALITKKSHQHDPDYTKYCGGTYSSEWFFSKVFHMANVAPEVYNAAASFVEHCDWMPGVLTGDTNPKNLKRSRCAAGHKAMFNDEWGGLPSQEFFSGIDRKLDGLIAKLYTKTYTADARAGGLSKTWAEKLGLKPGIAVSAGAFDAHLGAVGSGIKPGNLVKIMGTSACDMMIAPAGKVTVNIRGVCGQVDGSIVPGYLGIEAGQSAVGDIFAWWRDIVRWPMENILPKTSCCKGMTREKIRKVMADAKDTAYAVMTEKAKKIKPGQTGLLALDWMNGNRTILVDQELTGLILGIHLHTRPEEIFLALIEATAFGARVIMERIAEYGVPIEQVIACGGLAERNPLIMQVYADITGRPMRVAKSGQACALGAAMFGAVAGGEFKKVEDAREKMSGFKNIIYMPNPENRKVYDELYKLYRTLHDAFGTKEFTANLFPVMKQLLQIRK